MLKLLTSLKEHDAPSKTDMHAIRKEFLKKVLLGYIKKIPIKDDPEAEEGEIIIIDGFENFAAEFDIDDTWEERNKLQEQVLANIDQMTTRMVFNLY